MQIISKIKNAKFKLRKLVQQLKCIKIIGNEKGWLPFKNNNFYCACAKLNSIKKKIITENV